MKKAKLVLAAIAVLAIVGGTIAVKASKKFSTHTIWTTSAAGLAAVNKLVGATISNAGVNAFATTIQNNPAIATKTIAAD